MDTYIKGTCESMCPPAEIELRTREKLLHFFEKDHSSRVYAAAKDSLIKEFSRSAAGMRLPRPKDLRTTAALNKTVKYLMEVILPDERKPFNVVYDFIFDRLRAIRQEIVIQNLSTIDTICLLEPIIIFLAYSAYRLLSCEPYEKYDPKICHQHLQECLKKVLTCYDELNMDQAAAKTNAKPSNREYIEALYLLFNIGSTEALTRIFHVPIPFRNTLYMEAATISKSFRNDNFYKCSKEMRKLPHLLCAVASLKIQTIRREILLRFSIAYHSRIFTVPIDWLETVLACRDQSEVIRLCKYYNINCDAEERCVRFIRADFNERAPIMKSSHEYFVDKKLQNLQITDILDNEHILPN